MTWYIPGGPNRVHTSNDWPLDLDSLSTSMLLVVVQFAAPPRNAGPHKTSANSSLRLYPFSKKTVWLHLG